VVSHGRIIDWPAIEHKRELGAGGDETVRYDDAIVPRRSVARARRSRSFERAQSLRDDRSSFLRGLEHVPLSVSFADRVDETSSHVHAVCPDHHYLEAWGDAEPVTGSFSLIQPTIAPLFETRAAQESLLAQAIDRPVVPEILDDDIDHVTAEVVSGGTVVSGPVTLSSAGARQFAGTLSAPSGAGGYDVRVAVHNIYGIVEYVGDSKGPQPASRMMVDDATYPFSSITLSGDYFSSDAPVDYTLNVTTKATQPKVSVEIDGHKHSMDPVGSTGTQWSLTLSSGDLDDGDGFLETANVDLYLGNKADNLVDTYLHVRRSTYPFFDVYLDNTIVAPSSSVDVHVDLNEFDPAVPGQIFTLRVGSTGVETGNFGEINFKQIEHNTDYSLAPCPANPVGVSLGNNVKDWVADGYGGGVHIGDIIPLSPGNSGWTDRVIEDHILEHGDIVCTPVVTKFEQKSGGSYAVIVRKFAAFRIVSYDTQGTKGHIVAEFLEYVMTPDSFGSGSGGGTGTAYAARLVNP
jgi:hypothetical protein